MLNPIHFIIKLTFQHTGNMREFLGYLLNKLSVVVPQFLFRQILVLQGVDRYIRQSYYSIDSSKK